MTPLAASDPALGGIAQLAFGLAAGAALGLVHFGALACTVRCFATGRALRAAALQLGRFGLVAAALTGLAQLGGGPLIAGLVGLMLARQVLLRRIGGLPLGDGP